MRKKSVPLFVIGLLGGAFLVRLFSNGEVAVSYVGTPTPTAVREFQPPEVKPSQVILTIPTIDESIIREKVQVARIIDGDTVELTNKKKVRYIGIDTPEIGNSNRLDDCFATQSAQVNKSLVEGQTVELEKDISETDRYGRLLRYVYVDGEMINDFLIRQGYAHALTYPPDVKYSKQFREAELEARIQQRGLWKSCS